MLAAALAAAGLAALAAPGAVFARDGTNARAINGRVVAVGIPGAPAVSPVGAFLPGSPINSNSELAALTQPGRVMDPTRIVVGSRSNFGAPKANADQAAGSFLSIDPRAAQLAVPRRFASAGDQASVLGGAVQMYSAQSPAWLNGVYAPLAAANQTAVSNPLGMSINNAFGRLWPANAPYGLDGRGSSSIVDPDGRPLKGPLNPLTGGVYFGEITGEPAMAKDFLVLTDDGSQRPITEVAHVDMTRDGTNDPDEAEWLLPVRWINDVPRDQAIKDSDLFANQNSAVRLTHGSHSNAFVKPSTSRTRRNLPERTRWPGTDRDLNGSTRRTRKRRACRLSRALQ